MVTSTANSSEQRRWEGQGATTCLSPGCVPVHTEWRVGVRGTSVAKPLQRSKGVARVLYGIYYEYYLPG